MTARPVTYVFPRPTLWSGHREMPAFVTWNQARAAAREGVQIDLRAVLLGAAYPNACWSN